MPLSVVLHDDSSSPRSSAFGRVTLWVVLDRLHVISCIVTISRVERFDVVFQLCPTRHRGLQLGLPNARQTGRHLKSDLVETQHYAECPCPIDDRARQWDRVDVKIIISLWRSYSEVVTGPDRERSSDDLPDEVRDLASYLCLVLIFSVRHIGELVNDELWSNSCLDEVLHNPAKKFRTFDTHDVHLHGRDFQTVHLWHVD